MKTVTASNIAVSLATGMAEVVAEYETQIRELKAALEAHGHLLKQSTDDRSKVISVVQEVHGTLFDRLVSLGSGNDERVFLNRVLVQLSAIPWPIPLRNTVSTPPPAG